MFQHSRTVVISSLAAAALFVSPAAIAQTADNVVGVHEFWTTHAEGSPKECWSVSKPTGWKAFEDGKEVQASRGDILFFVAFRPAEGVSGEVAYRAGYPLADGSTVTVEIGDSKFTLVTDDNWAWPPSKEEDARIVEALKGGASATVSGESSRGKVTKDQFSLIGFTDSYEDAEKNCAG